MGKNWRLDRIGQTYDQFKDMRESNARLAIERKAVRMLSRRLGIDVPGAKTNTDDEEYFMTFAWFYDKHPSFPAILSAIDVFEPPQYEWLKPHSKNNMIWSKWHAVKASLGGTRPIGFMFPYPQVVELGWGVMHNLRLPFFPPGETMFSRQCCTTADGEEIVLENLDTFAARLLLNWNP
jgi:hypothetical protein